MARPPSSALPLTLEAPMTAKGSGGGVGVSLLDALAPSGDAVGTVDVSHHIDGRNKHVGLFRS